MWYNLLRISKAPPLSPLLFFFHDAKENMSIYNALFTEIKASHWNNWWFHPWNKTFKEVTIRTDGNQHYRIKQLISKSWTGTAERSIFLNAVMSLWLSNHKARVHEHNPKQLHLSSIKRIERLIRESRVWIRNISITFSHTWTCTFQPMCCFV